MNRVYDFSDEDLSKEDKDFISALVFEGKLLPKTWEKNISNVQLLGGLRAALAKHRGNPLRIIFIVPSTLRCRHTSILFSFFCCVFVVSHLILASAERAPAGKLLFLFSSFN
jgi:hypothetical protein